MGDDITLLFRACGNGNSEVVSTLLAKQGVDVNQARDNGATPLYIASHNGHSEVVTILLAKQGVDVNQAWKRSERHLVTPLYLGIL